MGMCLDTYEKEIMKSYKVRYSQAYIESYKVTQGSTFKNVCIDLDDIIYARTRWGTRVRREPNEALKLLYVAMSRASHHAYLKL